MMRSAKKSRVAVLVAPTATQPRFHRRASDLIDLGFDVRVYAFDRGYYEGNRFPAGVQLISLPPVKAGRFASRIPTIARSIGRIVNDLRGVPVALIHGFGLDCGLIAGVASKVLASEAGIEVGDLRQGRSQLASLSIKIAADMALESVSYLVVTSPGFVNHVASRRAVRRKEIAVIENRVGRAVMERWDRIEAKPASGRRIVLGFVGFIRYENCLRPIIEAVGRDPERFEMRIFGDGPSRNMVESLASIYSNVSFHGPFINPDDLGDIYRQIDVNVVVYDNADLNVRLAIPNKFFESLYFGTPIVCAMNTELARRVLGLRVGFAVDPGVPDFAAQLLRELNVEALCNMATSISRVPTADLVQGEELSDLLRKLDIPSGLTRG